MNTIYKNTNYIFSTSKKIIFSLSLSGLFLFQTSCTDFLDLKPIDTPTEDTFYNNENALQAGVISLYDGLQSGLIYGSTYLTVAEVRGDNLTDNNPGAAGGVRYQIESFSETSENKNLSDTWQGFYTVIYRANILLDKAPNVAMDETRKREILAQAKFVRALSYFNLIQLFGKVPLIITVQTTAQARDNHRANITEIYTQIESDLKSATTDLPQVWTKNADIGKATNLAALALLGKVYLYQKKYSEVNATLEPLVALINAKTQLSLVPQTSTFPNGIKTSKDIIFGIYYLAGGIGESANINNRYRNQDSNNLIVLPQSLYNNSDNRRALVVSPSSGSRPGKFNATTIGTESNGDFPVLRCADVMLMYAEAQNEISFPNAKALTALNAVRTNSQTTTYTNTTLVSQDTFRKAVYLERRLELALECDRWFDIIRTGQMKTVMPEIPSFRAIYPIPQVEIDNVNDKTGWQNEGY
ncbi:RagB/SusD family nutrient uptake outer membrane protein [Flavobacterium sp. LAR06]|uniref:RagB/SusD family nutrient uptake outer membrane protein n=1 Tax=Flavobacterium sp. LAR06 TaxID=3064897 RepID=UPI0035C01088